MNIHSGRVLPGRLQRRATGPANLAWYGLAIFTFFFITARLPELFTEFGIYLALLGLTMRPHDVGFPAPVRWAVVFLLWALATTLFAIAPETSWAALIERLGRWSSAAHRCLPGDVAEPKQRVGRRC